MTARGSANAKPARQPAPVGRGRGPRVPERYYRRLHVAVLVFGFVACGVASLLLGQDNNWDLRNYHYYNPYAFLHDRIGFDFAPAQRQSYLNPLADVPFYLGANHLDPRVFGFLLGGIHGVSLGLIFGICFVVLRSAGPNLRVLGASLCAVLGVCAPVFVGELGASQNNTLVGMFVLASLWIWIRPLAEKGTLAGRESLRPLLLGAFVFGLGMGLKLTVMPHALAGVAAILVAEPTWRGSARVLALGGAALLAGFLVTNGWWMARLWHEFQNPLFPFYNNVFKSGWAETRSFADTSMLPKTVWEAVALPFTFAYDNRYTFLQNGFRDARYAVLYVLLGLLVGRWAYRLVTARRKGRTPHEPLAADRRFLLWFFVVSFVAWEASFCIIRYTVTLEALAPLLIAVLTCELWRRRGIRVLTVSAAVLIIVALVRPTKQPRVPWGDRFWEVQVPAIVNPHNALIIIANSRPLSYLVPQFAPEARWVSLSNNLTNPRRPTRMQGEIRHLLDTHPGDIYLLTRSPGNWLPHDQRVLARYQLSVEGEPMPIVSPYSPPGLQLRRVRRFNATSGHSFSG